MQKLFPKMPQLNSENRYPECVCIELEAAPIESDEVNLPVTMHFNEQWEPLLDGRVKFGVKGGELKVNLENAELPDDSRHPTNQLQLQKAEETADTPASDSPSVCQLDTDGSQSNPTWLFDSCNASALKGVLRMENLGTLKITNRPCNLVVTFEVSEENVYLDGIEGIYPADISRNKQLVLDILLKKHLTESKLKPYISRLEWHYGE